MRARPRATGPRAAAAEPKSLRDVETNQRPTGRADVLSGDDMASLQAQAEHARARPRRQDMTQGGRDLLGVVDQLRRAALPAARPRDLDGATTTEVEAPRARGQDNRRAVDVVDAGDDAQRAAAAPAGGAPPAGEAQHAD